MMPDTGKRCLEPCHACFVSKCFSGSGSELPYRMFHTRQANESTPCDIDPSRYVPSRSLVLMGK